MKGVNSKTRIVSFIAIALLGLALVSIVRRVIGQNPPPCLPEFVPMLQAGIATEAPPPTNVADVTPAVAKAALFFQNRAGLKMSSAVQERLAQLEQESMNRGGASQLTRRQVKAIFFAVFDDAVVGVTDAQINAMATGSFQVMPGWTPPNRIQDLDLKISGPNCARATFVDAVQQLRAGSPVYTAAAAYEIGSEVDHLCDIMAYAIPSSWGGPNYSPYRVFVMAYSLTAGDDLSGSYSDGITRMSEMQNWMSRQGFNCPCEGRCLFGDEGYLYTRPLSIAFSDSLQINLLNRYAAAAGLN